MANNRREVLHLFLNLERRLQRKSRLLEQYVAFMDKYQSLGHMELITAADIHRDDAFYLPHHAVFKNTDPTNKIRVVFNASYRTSTRFLLNDTLIAGPKL